MATRPRPELWALALVALSMPGAAADSPPTPPSTGSPFDAFELGKRKEPITVSANTLEYDYKKNVVVYRGAVDAAQGPVRLRGDTLTITLETAPHDRPPSDGTPSDGGQRVRQIVAEGNVRIDNGTRWATGGKAVFNQIERTVVLSDSPVMHDGPNEVAGDKVVVFLDEDRSVVEGGKRRVKAVLHPGKDGDLAPSGHTAETTAAAGAASP